LTGAKKGKGKGEEGTKRSSAVLFVLGEKKRGGADCAGEKRHACPDFGKKARTQP